MAASKARKPKSRSSASSDGALDLAGWAWERAVRLLVRHDRSEYEIRCRLAALDITAPVVEATIRRLKALGYLDERSVRQVTARVTRTAFGPNHIATRMAEGDLWRLYPFLAHAPGGHGRHLRVVPRFDLATTDQYIR